MSYRGLHPAVVTLLGSVKLNGPSPYVVVGLRGMESQTKRSSSRALARVFVPSTERETLIPCPACEGQGRHLQEGKQGMYKMRSCRWCDGKCFVDHAMHRLFKRWLRILNYNRLRNACPKK